jgi:hypothetical protein
MWATAELSLATLVERIASQQSMAGWAKEFFDHRLQAGSQTAR